MLSAAAGYAVVRRLLTVVESVVLFGQRLDAAVVLTVVVVVACVGAAQRARVRRGPAAVSGTLAPPPSPAVPTSEVVRDAHA